MIYLPSLWEEESYCLGFCTFFFSGSTLPRRKTQRRRKPKKSKNSCEAGDNMKDEEFNKMERLNRRTNRLLKATMIIIAVSLLLHIGRLVLHFLYGKSL